MYSLRWKIAQIQGNKFESGDEIERVRDGHGTDRAN